MRFAEKARDQIFWLTDFAKGGPVRGHYREIRSILESPVSAETEDRRIQYLKSILKHAVATTTFYKPFKGFVSIGDFPVINKSVIKENQSSLFSDWFDSGKLHKVTTSGSTGAPLSVWQDKVKRQRHTAENIYFSELAGYPLGSRLYYLRVWNEINRKSLLLSWSQNIIMQDAGDLSDSNLEYFISRIEKDRSTKSVLAFSSTFEALAQYLQKSGRKVNSHVNSLITISETLPEGAREFLNRAFSCPVISRYSNMENGFLAQQCGNESGEYHINTSGFFIELLQPDKDLPVNEGETGRVVVTDLFNYAMPIIRYDTGDMAVLSEKSACGRPGPVLTTVEGRRVDFIYNANGNLLSPHVITNTMWKYSSAIRQFQFIQNDAKNYQIKLNTGNNVFEREAELITDIRNYLGSDAVINIEYVNEIPSLASGKRKKIINNYILH